MIKNILYLAILLTVFAISWIASSVYHNLATSTIPKTSQIQIIPITGKFDAQTLESLQERSVIQVDLKEIKENTSNESSPLPTTLIETTPLPTSTSSAQ